MIKKFIKAHSNGNDFVIFDIRDSNKLYDQINWGDVAVGICSRRFGVGADGLILVRVSHKYNVGMSIFNSDGSNGDLCINGTISLTEYIIEEDNISLPSSFDIETDSVVVNSVIDKYKNIKIRLESVRMDDVYEKSLDIEGETMNVFCIDLGNPHSVLIHSENDIDRFELSRFGPLVEKYKDFEKGTNFEIIYCESDSKIRARVWERGAGETLSCGSGTAASHIVAYKNGLVGTEVDILMPGGVLHSFIENVEKDKIIPYISGRGNIVFAGEWDLLQQNKS